MVYFDRILFLLYGYLLEYGRIFVLRNGLLHLSSVHDRRAYAGRQQTERANQHMASATSRFMLAAGVPATGGGSSGRVSFVSVPSRLQGRRLVVRAEEEAAAAEAPTAEGEGVVATKPKTEKPPPIGPKWGAKTAAAASAATPTRVTKQMGGRSLGSLA
ncbi:photosystem I reaction center subunit IV, chloroplastic-like isoform X3 [Panicum hallii]|uniref:photosystem I reaction center subunit IV, chloroplastic-like isoform X3 n=1 Tax=Panicum hallii TaxID=206008 RepID=UPI000DF4F02C|nr:photosystem I reaction center subunit IV, chloroplastic-like isoform X3 [Panicum hallii]